jgi:hypothetical protein
MKLNVVLGQDLSAYAEMEMDVPDGASDEEIIAEIQKRIKVNPPIFHEDWESACALRIVSATQDVVSGPSNYILEDVALEPSPFDAGQVLQSWLKGHGPTLAAVVNSAAAARLIDEPVMEVHRGVFKTPSGESIEVEFECRKGATKEEKNLAFLEALAQIGTVDYLAIGDLEVRHGV